MIRINWKAYCSSRQNGYRAIAKGNLVVMEGGKSHQPTLKHRPSLPSPFPPSAA